MKTLIVSILILSTAVCYAQFTKTELSNNEIQSIEDNSYNISSERNPEKIKQILDSRNTIYFFEVENKGKVIFREALKKWTPFSLNFGRGNFDICLRYDDLDSLQILNLLESNRWTKKEVDNLKMVCVDSFKILKTNRNGIEINQLPDDQLKIKYYKLEEK